MRVGFDATSLLGARTGVGTMALRLLTGLGEREDLSVRAFANTWRGRHGLAAVAPPGVQVIDRPMPARGVHFAWRHTPFPPVEWITGPVDVVHGPNFIVAPAKEAARVLTVHDLTAVHHPELCTPHTRTYPGAIRRALDDGAFVHTVSDFVRSEILDVFRADPARVVTVANGVDHIEVADPADGHRLAGAERYILAIGTIEPRKNYPMLIKAFDALASTDPDLHLVIAGPDGWGLDAFNAAIASARYASRIVRLGMVDSAQRAALLRGARVFAFTSLYEGFGLPPLEAMSAGVPVVATNTGAVAEVCGDAADLVAVDDHEGLVDALQNMLTNDAHRRNLVERGSRRVTRYAWPKQVDGIVALYRLAQDSRG